MQLWPNLNYCPVICLEVLRKISSRISRDSRSQCRGFKSGSSEYNAEAISTQQSRSVTLKESGNKIIGCYSYVI
jgi:hypothetical protein